MFLLTDELSDSELIGQLVKIGTYHGRQEGSSKFGGVPLLEEMIRTLAKAPEKLDRVQELVTQIRKAPDSESVLPADFESIWAPLWAARQKVIKEQQVNEDRHATSA
jgi:hypothetical protein